MRIYDIPVPTPLPPVSLDSGEQLSGFIYRMWNGKNECLYIGKTTAANPDGRIISSHRKKKWYSEVTRIDVMEVPLNLDLTEVEDAQIGLHNPKYNESFPVALIKIGSSQLYAGKHYLFRAKASDVPIAYGATINDGIEFQGGITRDHVARGVFGNRVRRKRHPN